MTLFNVKLKLETALMFDLRHHHFEPNLAQFSQISVIPGLLPCKHAIWSSVKQESNLCLTYKHTRWPLSVILTKMSHLWLSACVCVVVVVDDDDNVCMLFCVHLPSAGDVQ